MWPRAGRCCVETYVTFGRDSCVRYSWLQGEYQGIIKEEGDALFRQGNFNGAIVYYKNALKRDANFLSARFNLALAYLETGKLEQAERELQKVLLQDPYDSRVNLHLGRIANLQNKPDLSTSFLTTYLKAHPNDAACLEQLAFATTIQGDAAAARIWSRPWPRSRVGLQPGSPARNYMSQDERAPAREILEHLLSEQLHKPGRSACPGPA